MSDFLLKKWYLDAADEQGNVYIGYLVSLHWRQLELHGYHHLWRTAADGIQTQSGLTQQPSPVWEKQERLSWHPHVLSATWDSLADGLHEVLLTTEQGEITWRCTQPKAMARIQLPQLAFTGWGYTECLEITLPVWELPFKRLHWGRCHSEHHYAVWISWDGATTQHISWHDGQRTTDLALTAMSIRGSDWQLNLGEPLSLRRGTLLSTVFRPYRHLTDLFPETTFLANEQKWYAVGHLESANSVEPAIAIYEEVIW